MIREGMGQALPLEKHSHPQPLTITMPEMSPLHAIPFGLKDFPIVQISIENV